jgi:hypothetical protein
MLVFSRATVTVHVGVLPQLKGAHRRHGLPAAGMSDRKLGLVQETLDGVTSRVAASTRGSELPN